jgi:hypothetical protein
MSASGRSRRIALRIARKAETHTQLFVMGGFVQSDDDATFQLTAGTPTV